MYLHDTSNQFVLTAKDRCEFVGHGFNPIKIHKPTMQTMMAISCVIDAREPMVFMVEKAQTNHFLDATKLIPVTLTDTSYVDRVECMC